MDTMESEANERTSSNSGNSVGTTEQLHSRHGHERIAVSATNSHHHQFGISSAESFLNSELVASLSSDLTTPTSIHSTEKCSPPNPLPSNNLHDNSISNKKSVIGATNNRLTSTTKQVLKKYFVENSCDSSVSASSKNPRKPNSSDGATPSSSKRIGSVGDSGSENSNQLNNWFPSKRNSLINLLDNSNNTSGKKLFRKYLFVIHIRLVHKFFCQ